MAQPLYAAWRNMMNRCTKPSHPQFHNYGGRGITVCKEWFDFDQFVDDMRPTWRKGLTLDRTDNDGGYSPFNCAWVTMAVQGRNRRTSTLIEFNGRTQTLMEWSRETGIPNQTISARLKRGWSPDRVLGF
jgi:hypothetical protein